MNVPANTVAAVLHLNSPSEVPECHFCCILLVRAVTSLPRFKRRDTDPWLQEQVARLHCRRACGVGEIVWPSSENTSCPITSCHCCHEFPSSLSLVFSVSRYGFVLQKPHLDWQLQLPQPEDGATATCFLQRDIWSPLLFPGSLTPSLLLATNLPMFSRVSSNIIF